MLAFTNIGPPHLSHIGIELYKLFFFHSLFVKRYNNGNKYMLHQVLLLVSRSTLPICSDWNELIDRTDVYSGETTVLATAAVRSTLFNKSHRFFSN
jgi:hypothetical protein